MPTTNPPDIDLEIYSKIWEWLNGYGPWAAIVKEENQIRSDEDDSNYDQDKKNKSDTDYPEAILEQIAGGSTTFFSDQTFGTMGDTPCANWVESQSHNYRMTLTLVGTSMKEASGVRRLTTNALRLAGPKLGLDYVTKWTFRWALTRKQDAGETDRVMRSVITIDVLVESESSGRHLTGEI